MIFEVVYDGRTGGWVVIIIILLNISFLVSLAGGWVQNDHALYPNIGARTFFNGQVHQYMGHILGRIFRSEIICLRVSPDSLSPDSQVFTIYLLVTGLKVS